MALDRRLRALGDYGSQAAGLRAGDVGVSQSNADAINRWREFSALQQQQANLANQAERSRAADYNVGTTQRVGEQNALADYEAQVANINRANQARGMQAQTDLNRAAQIANQYGALATDAYNQQKAKAGQIQGVSQGLGSSLGGIGGLVGGLF